MMRPRLVCSALAFVYVLGLLIYFAKVNTKKARHRPVWSWNRSVCILAHVGIIFICMTDAILSNNESASHCWASYTQLLSTGVASFTSLTAIFLGCAEAWHAFYMLFGTCVWASLSLLVPVPSRLTLTLPFLFLLALISILGGPFQVPDGAHEHPLTRTALATCSKISAHHLWPLDEKLGKPYVLTEAEAALDRWCFLLSKGLASVLLLEYTGPLLSSGVLALVDILSTFLQPFLLGALLEQRRFIFALGLAVTGMIGGAAKAHSRYQLRMAGMRLRSALTAQICDRNLEVVSTPAAADAPDSIVLMEVDLPQVFALVEVIHVTYLGPIQCVVSFIALAYILSWQSVLAGCGIMVSLASYPLQLEAANPGSVKVIGIPLFSKLMSIIFQQMARVMAAKDARVSMVNEMLAQVRQIKLHGWQPFFRTKIDGARADELGEVGRVALVNSALVALSSIMPPGLVALTLLTYVAMGGQLTSQIMFPALAFFFNINSGLQALSQLAMVLQAGVISLERIKDHLLPLEQPHERLAVRSEAPSVVVEQATFYTPDHGMERKVLLQDCNFEALPKSLTVISGPLGSGKSTFLRSLIGGVRQVDGNINMSGTIAYSPQVPVLIHGTVRDNIIFGLPFHPSFYQRVIDATALRVDLASLAHGDQTMLGGTGAALSGGQKSRVALARAVYSGRDIVVLDDPLAALDAKVRGEVVRQVFGPEGILKDRIRIITSSYEPLIEVADGVYNIADRRLVQGAEFDTTSSLSDPEAFSVAEEPLVRIGPVVPSTTQIGCGTFPIKSIEPFAVPVLGTDAREEEPLLARQPTEGTTSEQSGVEGVPLRTYITYLGMANKGGWYIVIVLAVTTKLADVAALFFLKLASEGTESLYELAWFTALSSAGAIISFAFIMVAYFLCLIPASRRLHDRLTKGVLESKFVFFDDNAPGQTLSRFTNDINKVDSQLNAGLIRIVMAVIMALVPIVVIFSAVPLSVVYLVPLGLLYKYVQASYLDAYRQLRRLENVSREGIINTAEEIKTSVSVIRCFDQAPFFQRRARSAIDGHVIAWGPFLALTIWLDLRLQLLASLVTLLSATLILSLDTPSSTVGLVMNFVLQITTIFNTLVEVRAGLEADITSYERIQAYNENPSEDDADAELGPPSDWPSNGSIVFDSYTASYRPGGKPCLRSISLVIHEGEHVAVVGRTGAGKSSIVLALLRAIDKTCTQGSIHIDGLDISSLSLAAIRRRIALIPQEPVVFSGTLRENLDPLGDVNDSELRRALAACQVAEILGIAQSEDPLERRILRSRRLIRWTSTDEATAAIDAKTDATVQQVLKSSFRECTIISVTHNMESARAYDRVLVINRGSVAGYDTPQALLQSGKLGCLS
ncbi:hypothetical protein ACJ41O_001485 [Fusarium nematophilum]